MKFLSTILFSLLFCSLLSGQDYKPLIEENKHHFASSIISAGWMDGYIDYVMRGDTIVDDLNYKKVYRQSFNELSYNWVGYQPPYELKDELLFALVREEVEERKVYARLYDESFFVESFCGDSFAYEEEFLLYDFSQELGDTMSFCPLQGHYPDDTLIVKEISEEEIEGEIFKVIIYGDDFRDYRLCEGLGGREGIFSQLNQLSVDEGWYALFNICVGTNQECGIVDLVRTEEVLPLANEIHLSPNPTSGDFQLSLSDVVNKEGSFQITDLTGRLVHREEIGAGTYLRSLNLPVGVYALTFTREGTLLWRDKLLVMRE